MKRLLGNLARRLMGSTDEQIKARGAKPGGYLNPEKESQR